MANGRYKVPVCRKSLLAMDSVNTSSSSVVQRLHVDMLTSATRNTRKSIHSDAEFDFCANSINDQNHES